MTLAEGKHEDRSTKEARSVVRLSVVFLFALLLTGTGPASGESGPSRPSVCLGSGRTTDPVYPDTCLTLAWNHEKKGDYREAEEAYSTCLQSRDVPGRLKQLTRERATWLALQITKQEVDSASREWNKWKDMLDTARASDNSITVVPFVDLSGDEMLQCLGPGVVGILIRALHRVESLLLVERSRVAELKRERDLADSSFMLRDTLRTVGGIFRVDKVITGTLDRSGVGDIEIRGVIYSRNLDSYLPVQSIQGGLHRVTWLLKELAFAILSRLDIALSPREENEITELFTESMEAFLAYCLGLASMDEGNYVQAAKHFEEALRWDPDFEPAKEMAKKARDLVEAGGETDHFVSVCVSILRQVEEHKAKEGRLRCCGKKGTGNFIPDDANSPSEDKPEDTSSAKSVGTVTIRGTIR